MNFLAHLYLSGDNELVRVGNFVGDWIKGNEYKKYPADIQKGIQLHRSIDFYTDNHPIVKQSKSRFSEKYHKYAGIIIDICYDHFLAKNWDAFSTITLPEFTKAVKMSLYANMHYFPKDLQEFIPRFMNHGWLESYNTILGIEKVLEGMAKHTSLPDKTDDAILIFERDYEKFKEEFYEYFPQLSNHIETKFQIPLNKFLP
jgi:acyl carrier protein phosphodiesterase